MNTDPGRKCRLPRENKEGKLDDENEIWENDETPEVKHWKEQLASAYRSYKTSRGDRKQAFLSLMNDAKKKLAYYRCVFFEQVLEKTSRNHQDFKDFLLKEWEWDSSKAETIASHMINSHLGDNQKHLQGKTIKYLLRKYGQRENKINLFQYYVNKEKEVNNENRFHEAALFVWGHIRDVMIDRVGIDIAMDWISEYLTNDQNDYAVNKIQRLTEAMRTSRYQGVNNRMGIEYETKTDEQTLVFYHAHGNIFFSIRRVGINVDDLADELYPDNIKSIVTKAISREPEYSAGLYVSIRVTFDGTNPDADIDIDNVDEHYLLLSEYNRKFTKGVYAEGYSNRWLRDQGNILSQSFTVTQPLLKTSEIESNYTEWTMHGPLTEQMIFTDIIQATCTAREAREVNFVESITDFRHWIDQNNRHIPAKLPIQNYVFSGDNFMFIVVVYDLNVTWVRKLFPDWSPSDENGTEYVTVYALHYPALFLNIDRFMARVEYKNYIRVTHGRGIRWRDFKIGRKHEKEHPNDKWDPIEFQDQDNVDFGEDWETTDKNHRTTFPLKKITGLQFHATWEGFEKRREYKGVQIRDESNIKSYFVNNIERNPNVVYRYYLADTEDTTPIWESFQLYRINAEREVSKYMKSINKPTFFEERMKWTNGGTPAPETYFFKQYLEDHEEARLQWVEIWKRQYNFRDAGWTRIDQDRDDSNSSRDDEGDGWGNGDDNDDGDEGYGWGNGDDNDDGDEGNDEDNHDGDEGNDEDNHDGDEGNGEDNHDGDAGNDGNDDKNGGEEDIRFSNRPLIITKLTDEEKNLLQDEGVSSKENLETATQIKHTLEIMGVYAGVENIDRFAQFCSLMISVYGNNSDACDEFLHQNFTFGSKNDQWDHYIQKIKEERASKVGKKGKKSRAQYQQKPLQKKQEARREPTRASLARQVNANHRAQNTRFLLNLLYTSNSR